MYATIKSRRGCISGRALAEIENNLPEDPQYRVPSSAARHPLVNEVLPRRRNHAFRLRLTTCPMTIKCPAKRQQARDAQEHSGSKIQVHAGANIESVLATARSRI